MARTEQLKQQFTALVGDGDATCDLARGALAIARIAYPDLDPDPSLQRLDALAADVRPRLQPTTAGARAVDQVTRYLFGECGYRGNATDFYDPRNSFLNDVLERRTGIPISLAVLLMEVGVRLGVQVEGVGFPGHFLVRVEGEAGPVVLDPFAGGKVMTHEDLLARLRAYYTAGGGPPGSNLQRVLPQALQASGPRAILARMLANLLRVYLDRTDHAHALDTVELMLVLHPRSPELLRTRGLLYERLECFASARRDLERYLALAPRGPHAEEVRGHLDRLDGPRTTIH